MKKRTFLYGLLVLVLAGSLTAGELNLSDAIARARDHSHQLKRAEAEHAASTSDLSAARKARYPMLSAEALANYRSEVASLDVALPGGAGFQREIGTKEHYQFNAMVSLPLYTGGRITGGIKQAGSMSEYQAAIRDATDERLVLSVRLAYFALVQADRNLDAARAAHRRASILNEDVRSMYDAGIADSVDLLETRHTMNNADLRLQEAQIASRQASIELAVLLGIDPAEQITPINKLSSPDPVASPPTTVAADKPELRAADAMVDVRSESIGLSQSNYLPDFSISGGYHYGKPNIDMFNDTWNDHFTIGARLTWAFNLGNRTGSQVAAARHRLRAAASERNRTAEQLTEQARLASEQLKLAWQRYSIAERELTIRRDTYRLSRQKHQNGALSTNRLLELEAALSEAEANHARTLAGFYQAQSAYWYAIGSDELEKGM